MILYDYDFNELINYWTQHDCVSCVLFEIGILRVGTGDGTRDRISKSFYLLNCNKAKAASFDPTAA